MSNPITYACMEGKPNLINKIHFRMLSPEQIEAMSVVRVTETSICDKGMPKWGGVNDIRMGTVDNSIACGTCGNRPTSCPGHPGHIELEIPLYCDMIDMIVKYLKCVCFWCSRLLVSGHPFQGVKYKNRLKMILTAVKRKKKIACIHCNGCQPNYMKNKKTQIFIDCTWPEDTQWASEAQKRAATSRPFTSIDAHSILRRVPDQDVGIMGLDPRIMRPHYLVRTHIMVSPPAMRPFVTDAEGSRGQDDITLRYKNIVTLNKDIAKHYAAEYRKQLESEVPPELIAAKKNSKKKGPAIAGKRKASSLEEEDDNDDDSVASSAAAGDAVGLADEEEEDEEAESHDAKKKKKKQRIVCYTPALQKLQDEIDARALMGSTYPVHWYKMVDKEMISLPPEKLIYDLQYEYSTLFKSNIAAVKQSTPHSGAPLKSLDQMVSGKTGIFRGAINSKRVDHSGRTVTSPCVHIDVHEIGIPRQLALQMTYPELVNQYNIAELTKRVRIGSGNLRGAANVIDSQGKWFTLPVKSAKEAMTTLHEEMPLQFGWTVERYVQDGDVVVVNRQPSLHKQSMMGHIIKIIDGHTIRLNPSCTRPYNADFDGDELNFHFPQSEAARAEVMMTMGVPYQIISAQSNNAIISMVQDSLLALFDLTSADRFVTREQACQIISQFKYWQKDSLPHMRLPVPAILRSPKDGPHKGQPLWTGKQIFSLLCPNKVFMDRCTRDLSSNDKPNPPDDDEQLKAREARGEFRIHNPCESYMDREERRVVIRDGELLAGRLCKQTMGTSEGSLIQVVNNDVGPWEVSRFISDCQRVATIWNQWYTRSISIRDTFLTDQVRKAIDLVKERTVDAFKKAHYAARGLVPPEILKDKKPLSETSFDEYAPYREAHARGMAGLPPKRLDHIIPLADHQNYTTTLGNDMVNHIGRILKITDRIQDNSYAYISTVGSKGNYVNNAQIRGSVGQQCVDGKPIQSLCSSRTSSFYAHGDFCPDPESTGLVINSFADGLNPQQYACHAMGTREGIIDTNVKTSTSGYIQRKFSKRMESHFVSFFGRVCNSSGEVIQFNYGGDGMDPTKIERQYLPSILWSDARVISELKWATTTSGNETLAALLKSEVENLIALRDEVRIGKIQCPGTAFTLKGKVGLAVNVQRMVEVVSHEYNQRAKKMRLEGSLTAEEARLVTAEEVITETQMLCEQLFYSSLYRPAEGPVTFGQVCSADDIDLVRHEVMNSETLIGKMPLRGTACLRLAIQTYMTSKRIYIERKFTKAAWDRLRALIVERYYSAFIPFGQMVGTLAAQSMGEPTTQMTLNTFHHAGRMAKNVTLGLPRFQELMEITNNTKKPAMTIPLRPPFSLTARGASIAARCIEHLPLEKLVLNYGTKNIHVGPPNNNSADLLHHPDIKVVLDYITSAYEASRQQCPQVNTIKRTQSKSRRSTNSHVLASPAPPSLRANSSDDASTKNTVVASLLFLSKKALRERGLVPADVAKAVRAVFGDENACVRHSEGHEEQWWVAIRPHAVNDMMAHLRRENPNALEEQYDKMEKAILQKAAENISLAVTVAGIPGITRVIPTRTSVEKICEATKEVIQHDEWVLETEGSNMPEVMRLPFVDHYRTCSIDPQEVNRVLGIEAATMVLHEEIKKVISFDGTYVDARHTSNAADAITMRGEPFAMSRNGIAAIGNSAIESASFEKTVEVLQLAGIYGDTDEMKNGAVTLPVVLGQTPKFGTNSCDILLDRNRYVELLGEEQGLWGPDKIHQPHESSPFSAMPPMIYAQ